MASAFCPKSLYLHRHHPAFNLRGSIRPPVKSDTASKSEAKPASPPKPTSFLDLPAEIRNKVYVFYINEVATEFQGSLPQLGSSPVVIDTSRPFSQIWPILYTSCQISQEAMAIYCGLTVTHFRECRKLCIAFCNDNLTSDDRAVYQLLAPSRYFKTHNMIRSLVLDLGLAEADVSPTQYREDVDIALAIINHNMPSLQHLRFCVGGHGGLIDRGTFPKAWLLEHFCQASGLSSWKLDMSGYRNQEHPVCHISSVLSTILQEHCRSETSAIDGNQWRIGADLLTGAALQCEIVSLVIARCDRRWVEALEEFHRIEQQFVGDEWIGSRISNPGSRPSVNGASLPAD